MLPSNNSHIVLSVGIKPEIPAEISKERFGQLHTTFALCHTWEADRWHHRVVTAILPCVQRGKLSQYLWSETLASAKCNKKTPQFTAPPRDESFLFSAKHALEFGMGKWILNSTLITKAPLLLSCACFPTLGQTEISVWNRKETKGHICHLTQFSQLKTCWLEISTNP